MRTNAIKTLMPCTHVNGQTDFHQVKLIKSVTCIMAWLLLTFGNICRGFLKKKLTTGKQVTKPLLKNTQQKAYDTPVILNHNSSVRFSPS